MTNKMCQLKVKNSKCQRNLKMLLFHVNEWSQINFPITENFRVTVQSRLITQYNCNNKNADVKTKNKKISLSKNVD